MAITFFDDEEEKKEEKKKTGGKISFDEGKTGVQEYSQKETTKGRISFDDGDTTKTPSQQAKEQLEGKDDRTFFQKLFQREQEVDAPVKDYKYTERTSSAVKSSAIVELAEIDRDIKRIDEYRTKVLSYLNREVTPIWKRSDEERAITDAQDAEIQQMKAEYMGNEKRAKYTSTQDFLTKVLDQDYAQLQDSKRELEMVIRSVDEGRSNKVGDLASEARQSLELENIPVLGGIFETLSSEEQKRVQQKINKGEELTLEEQVIAKEIVSEREYAKRDVGVLQSFAGSVIPTLSLVAEIALTGKAGAVDAATGLNKIKTAGKVAAKITSTTQITRVVGEFAQRVSDEYDTVTTEDGFEIVKVANGQTPTTSALLAIGSVWGNNVIELLGGEIVDEAANVVLKPLNKTLGSNKLITSLGTSKVAEVVKKLYSSTGLKKMFAQSSPLGELVEEFMGNLFDKFVNGQPLTMSKDEAEKIAGSTLLMSAMFAPLGLFQAGSDINTVSREDIKKLPPKVQDALTGVIGEREFITQKDFEQATIDIMNDIESEAITEKDLEIAQEGEVIVTEDVTIPEAPEKTLIEKEEVAEVVEELRAAIDVGAKKKFVTPTEDGVVVGVEGVVIPEFIPEELRTRDLLTKATDHLLEGTTPKVGTKVDQVYQVILEEADTRVKDVAVETEESVAKYIKDRGLEADSINILDDQNFIVENEEFKRALLTDLRVSSLLTNGDIEFETLNEESYKAGDRQVTIPIEVTLLNNGGLRITDGANRFTQAMANGDSTIPAIIIKEDGTVPTPEEITKAKTKAEAKSKKEKKTEEKETKKKESKRKEENEEQNEKNQIIEKLTSEEVEFDKKADLKTLRDVLSRWQRGEDAEVEQINKEVKEEGGKSSVSKGSVLYHRTHKEFEEFDVSLDPDEMGTWFAVDKSVIEEDAESYPILMEREVTRDLNLISVEEFSEIEYTDEYLDSNLSPRDYLLNLDYDGISYGDTVLLLDPNNVTQALDPLQGIFSARTDKQVGKGIVKERGLVALHNTRLDKLRSAIKAGGLSVPSLAIVQRGEEFDSYGEISLIMKDDVINFGDEDFNAYAGDIYSPVIQSIQYNAVTTPEIRKQLSEIGISTYRAEEMTPEQFIEAYVGQGTVKKMGSKMKLEKDAKEIAKKLYSNPFVEHRVDEVPTELEGFDEFETDTINQVFEESTSGYDFRLRLENDYDLIHMIQDKLLKDEEGYIDDDEYYNKIFEIVDTYFLKKDANAENVTKYIKQKLAAQGQDEIVGTEGFFSEAPSKAFGRHKFENYEEMEAYTNLLSKDHDFITDTLQKNEEEFDSYVEDIIEKDELSAISNELENSNWFKHYILSYYQQNNNYPDLDDIVNFYTQEMQMMEEDYAVREAVEYLYDETEYFEKLIAAYGNLPTEYFEAKVMRTVQFDEVDKVLVPEWNRDEVVQLLDGQVDPENIIGYDQTAKNGRADAIKEVVALESRLDADTKANILIDSYEKRMTEATGEPFEMGEKAREIVRKYAQTIGEGYVPRRAMGVFFKDTKNIRVGNITDLSTVAHEVTHFIDNKYEISKRAAKDDALKSSLARAYMTYYPTSKLGDPIEIQMVEGMAVLVQKYVENPSMIKKDYAVAYHDILSEGGKYYEPVIGEFLKDLDSIVENYQGLDAVNKIGTRVAHNVKDENGKWMKGNFNPLNTLRTKVFDALLPAELMIQETSKKSGKQLADVSLDMRAYENNTRYIFDHNINSKGKNKKFDNTYITLDKDGNMTKALDYNWGVLTNRLNDTKQLDTFSNLLAARRVYYGYENYDKIKNALDGVREDVVVLRNRLNDVIEEEVDKDVDKGGKLKELQLRKRLIEKQIEEDIKDKAEEDILRGTMIGIDRGVDRLRKSIIKGKASVAEVKKDLKVARELEKMLETMLKEQKEILDNDAFDRNIADQAYNQTKEMFSEELDMYDNLVLKQAELLAHKEVNLITQEQLEEYKNNKGYTPFKRQFTDTLVANTDGIIAANIGGTKVTSTIRRKGSQKEIINPLYSSIVSEYEILRKGIKQRIYNKWNQDELFTTYGDLMQRVELQRAVDGQGRVIYPQEKDNNIIMARDSKGKRVPILMDADLKRMIDDVFTYENTDGIMKAMIKHKAFFSKMTTAADIAWLATNLPMDQITAAINSQTGYKPLVSGLKTLSQRLANRGGKEAEYAREYLMLGGERQTFIGWQDMTSKELEAAITKETKAINKMIDRIDKGISFLGTQSEIFTRQSEYVRARVQGDNQLEALEKAARVTASFSHMGSFQFGKNRDKNYKQYIRTIAFFNPALQVLDTQYNTWIKSPKGRRKIMIAYLAFASAQVAQTLAIAGFADDDDKEQYKDLHPEDLMRYIYFPRANGEGLARLRVPQNIMFAGTLMNMAIMEEMFGVDYSATDYAEVASAWIPSSFNPAPVVVSIFDQVEGRFKTEAYQFVENWIPQSLEAILFPLMNVRAYPEGGQIESEGMKYKAPADRAYESTLGITKWIGSWQIGDTRLSDMIGISPILMDEFIRQGLGRATTLYLDKAWTALTGEKSTKEGYLTSSVLREYYFQYGKRANDFYNDADNVEQKYTALKGNTRDFSEDEILDLMFKKEMIGDIENAMNEYRDAFKTDSYIDIKIARDNVIELIDDYNAGGDRWERMAVEAYKKDPRPEVMKTELNGLLRDSVGTDDWDKMDKEETKQAREISKSYMQKALMIKYHMDLDYECYGYHQNMANNEKAELFKDAKAELGTGFYSYLKDMVKAGRVSTGSGGLLDMLYDQKVITGSDYGRLKSIDKYTAF